MKVLVTGAAGQLGSDLLLELTRLGIDHIGIDIQDVDITDKASVENYVKRYKPSAIIHCAAYTAVDAAEDNEDLCMRINRDGTAYLAQVCREIDAEMIYISTDYVFSGEGAIPYEIDSPKAPLQIYGKSKLAGEEAVTQYLDKFYIVRTSWVFGKSGNNFVKTMLQLSKEKDIINVVDDQIGSPTYTPDLSVLLCNIVHSRKYGTYHATNEGFCAWVDFAKEIMMLSDSRCVINPIKTEQYPTKANRPKNSRLSKLSLDVSGYIRLPDWHDALARYLSK